MLWTKCLIVHFGIVRKNQVMNSGARLYALEIGFNNVFYEEKKKLSFLCELWVMLKVNLNIASKYIVGENIVNELCVKMK